jgi:hypothetical protein
MVKRGFGGSSSVGKRWLGAEQRRFYKGGRPNKTTLVLKKFAKK